MFAVLNTRTNIENTSFAGCHATGISCGDRVERYYYAGWRVVEETDNAGTPRTLAQTVWGTEYIHEPVCRDRNTNVATNSDCLDSGGSLRYFYHQDVNFRVCSLTSESGAFVERYEYDAYGEPRVFCGSAASAVSEGAAPPAFSGVGNPYLHQGLRRDDESGLHENRYRSLHSRLGRFMQRDPLGYASGGLNEFEYLSSQVMSFIDPLGFAPDNEIEKNRDLLARKLKNVNNAGFVDVAATTAGVVLVVGGGVVEVVIAGVTIAIPAETIAALGIKVVGKNLVLAGKVLSKSEFLKLLGTKAAQAIDPVKAKALAEAIEAALKAALAAARPGSAAYKALSALQGKGAEGAKRALELLKQTGKIPDGVTKEVVQAFLDLYQANVAKSGTNAVFEAKMELMEELLKLFP